MKNFKFIAVADDRFNGYGDTPEEAIADAQDNAVDYDGEMIPASETVVYEVQRRGHAKITVEWVSE